MGRFSTGVALGACTLLMACGDPLGDVGRLSEVDLAEAAPEVEIASTEQEPVRIGALIGAILAPANEGVDPEEGPDGTGGGPRSIVERLGLDRFGGESTTPTLAAQPAPPPGVLVPFGEVAIACGLRGSELGTEVERVSGYRLYDTSPSAGGARTLYITGFDDGCARQVSGALALFGDIGTHEFLRYGPQSGASYSPTDRAYEEIKAQFCGVAAGAPCGGRLDRLARTTTFLTIYQRFGGGGPRLELLLHDGEVVARSVENQ